MSKEFLVVGHVDRKYVEFLLEGGYVLSPGANLILSESGPSTRFIFNLSEKKDRIRFELFLVDNLIVPF